MSSPNASLIVLSTCEMVGNWRIQRITENMENIGETENMENIGETENIYYERHISTLPTFIREAQNELSTGHTGSYRKQEIKSA